MSIAKDHKVNEQIRVRQIRLIGAEGEQIGIIDTREAGAMAREQNLDLVMVSPQAVPPVCKLMDYGRFRFEEQQNEKENRKRARSQEVKAIKFRVKIDDNDFKTKTNHVRRFLEEGHKVKVTIMFRGRERTHPELGERILLRVAETLADIGAPESNPSMMGMDMNIIMTPKAAPAAKKATAREGAGAENSGAERSGVDSGSAGASGDIAAQPTADQTETPTTEAVASA
jgi:translation initiation factor IF-3